MPFSGHVRVATASGAFEDSGKLAFAASRWLERSTAKCPAGQEYYASLPDAPTAIPVKAQAPSSYPLSYSDMPALRWIYDTYAALGLAIKDIFA